MSAVRSGPAFAAPVDLQNFLKLATINESQAAAMLVHTGNAVRNKIKRQIDLVDNDVVTLDGITSNTNVIFLPEWPVVAVAQVEVLDPTGTWVTLDPSTYDFDEDGWLEWLTDGVPSIGLRRGWPTRRRSIRVTYTHGYAEVPPELANVSVSAAARLWANPSDLQGETIDGYSFRVNVAASQWTDMEMAVLDEYSRAVGG